MDGIEIEDITISDRASRSFIIKDEVEIRPFDCSARGIRYQVLCNGRRLAVSSLVADILEFSRVERTEKDLNKFIESTYPSVHPNDMLMACRSGSLSFLFESLDINSRRDEVVPNKSSTIQFKIKLLSADSVRYLASRMTALFTPALTVCILALIAFIQIANPNYAKPVHAFEHLTWVQWIEVWAGVYIAIFIHELGHSAACCRFGCQPGPIGFAFYWTIPVLYSDTTDSWSLSRKQRIVVDLAGMYFHLIAGTVCIVLGKISYNPIFDIIAHSVLLSTVVNLNPFLRFDGYWLISDLTGIPNLQKTTHEYLKYSWTRLIRTQPELEAPRCLPCSKQILWFFITYVILSTVFFMWMTFRICVAIPHIFVILRTRLNAVQADIQHGLSTQLIIHILAFCITCWSLCLMARLILGKTKPLQERLRRLMCQLRSRRSLDACE